MAFSPVMQLHNAYIMHHILLPYSMLASATDTMHAWSRGWELQACSWHVHTYTELIGKGEMGKWGHRALQNRNEMHNYLPTCRELFNCSPIAIEYGDYIYIIHIWGVLWKGIATYVYVCTVCIGMYSVHGQCNFLQSFCTLLQRICTYIYIWTVGKW